MGSAIGVAFLLALAALGIATGLKFKWATLAIGFLLWPAWLVGAIRLAKPGSIWARSFYDDRRRARAAERAENPGAARVFLPIAAAAGAFVAVGFLATMKAYRIPSPAMEPTLPCPAPTPGCSGEEADRVAAVSFVAGITARRGDLVAFEAPAAAVASCGRTGIFVKRIVGMPGERIESRAGVVFVNGEPLDEPYVRGARDPRRDLRPIEIPADQFLMLGDNRPQSCDSREYGPVAESALIAKVLLIYWPLERFGQP